jgi:hypothetical protein
MYIFLIDSKVATKKGKTNRKGCLKSKPVQYSIGQASHASFDEGLLIY